LDVLSLGPGSVIIGLRVSGEAVLAGAVGASRCDVGSVALLSATMVAVRGFPERSSSAGRSFGDRGGVGVAVTAFAEVALASCFRERGAGDIGSCEAIAREGFEMGESGDVAREGEGGRKEGFWTD
jgi:hypothetical protein